MAQFWKYIFLFIFKLIYQKVRGKVLIIFLRNPKWHNFEKHNSLNCWYKMKHNILSTNKMQVMSFLPEKSVYFFL